MLTRNATLALAIFASIMMNTDHVNAKECGGFILGYPPLVEYQVSSYRGIIMKATTCPNGRGQIENEIETSDTELTQIPERYNFAAPEATQRLQSALQSHDVQMIGTPTGNRQREAYAAKLAAEKTERDKKMDALMAVQEEEAQAQEEEERKAEKQAKKDAQARRAMELSEMQEKLRAEQTAKNTAAKLAAVCTQYHADQQKLEIAQVAYEKQMQYVVTARKQRDQALTKMAETNQVIVEMTKEIGSIQVDFENAEGEEKQQAQKTLNQANTKLATEQAKLKKMQSEAQQAEAKVQQAEAKADQKKAELANAEKKESESAPNCLAEK